MTDEVVERLYDLADDVTISVSRDGRTAWIEFDRSITPEAIPEAIKLVMGSVDGGEVVRIEPDELVYAAEIAERLGRTRASVDHLIRGVRGPGNFPPPHSHAGARNPIWRWSAVREWFGDYEGRPVGQDDRVRRAIIASWNAAFELQRSLNDLPTEVAEEIRSKLREVSSA